MMDPNTILNLIAVIASFITLYYCKKAESNTSLLKDALMEATSKLQRAEGKEEARKEAANAGPIAVEIVDTQPPVPVKVVPEPGGK